MKCRARLDALVRDTCGAAAAEMVLVAPLLILIMFGAAETGRYFYHEHVLVKAVRDGAVFAARAPIDKFNCTDLTINQTVRDNTLALVRTGALSGQTDLLPWWTATSGVDFSMTLMCKTVVNGTTLGGIYTANGGNVPVITVSATLPYQSLLGTVGLPKRILNLNASEQAAVLGA